MLFQKLMGKGPTSMISPSAPKGLWSWGNNTMGHLGLGDRVYRSVPTQVGALTTWSQILGDNKRSLALKTDGTLWSWGYNDYGYLGLGDTIKRSSPVQVGALAAWSTIGSGKTSAFAIKTDGTLWSWGNYSGGVLGLGVSYVHRSSPTQVGTLATWSQITGGRNSISLALKTEGTLWVWGRGNGGQLGLGTYAVNHSSPVQVGTLTTWSQITAGEYVALAIKTDGTLWSWGKNTQGQLGQDIATTVYRSSPTQVGTLTTWSQIIAGHRGSLAIKTNGTLWSWGYNTGGQLGFSDIIGRSSPVQVGTLAAWAKIGAAEDTSFAIKIDGTLWAWGRNDYGKFGLGDTIHRSSPVQVGTLASWVKIVGGKNHLLGLHC